MSEAANAALGALIATTFFLLVFVIIGLRIFAWVKRAGFRFQAIKATQDDDGVRVKAAFKRTGFAQLSPRLKQVLAQATSQPEDVLTAYTIMVGLAAEKLRKGDRVTDTDKAGYVRLATAIEHELGTVDNDALPEQQVRIRVTKQLVEPVGTIAPGFRGGDDA